MGLWAIDRDSTNNRTRVSLSVNAWAHTSDAVALLKCIVERVAAAGWT